MSKIIQVLETMAADAALVNKENSSIFLTTAEISIEQQQAITEKNAEQLAETISDLPEIISFSQVGPIPIEDDVPEEFQENMVENKTAMNF